MEAAPEHAATVPSKLGIKVGIVGIGQGLGVALLVQFDHVDLLLAVEVAGPGKFAAVGRDHRVGLVGSSLGQNALVTVFPGHDVKISLFVVRVQCRKAAPGNGVAVMTEAGVNILAGVAADAIHLTVAVAEDIHVAVYILIPDDAAAIS